MLNSIHDIAPADMQRLWTGEDDLSVRAWIGWNEKGLLFAAEVNDDIHKNTVPHKIWSEDSLQLAFDLTEKMAPQSYGENSCELGLALAAGKVTSAVYTGKGGFTGIVVRRGTKTIYELFAPWDIAGKIRPVADDMISCSFIINDCDSSSRKWMELSRGIGVIKSPAKFPRFKLCKQTGVKQK